MRQRRFAVLLTALLTAIALTGCNNNAGGDTLKDGTYRAEMSAESHGYKDYVEITVVGGKIDTVVYDSQTADGKRKTQDEDYKKAMMDGNKNAGIPETYPADYSKKLTEALLEKQDINKVDTVAGATTSSDDFKALVSALMNNIKKGNTKTVVVDNTK